MTELQAKELELLTCVDAVCRELGIPYFLVCGSALGAVKYGGFIPWDDDIDIAMYRGDYEIFLREAPGKLPPNLFLQNYRSDPAFPQIYSKLRDSETTYIERTAAKLPMHHGVFMDIFPLDGYPKTTVGQNRLEFLKRCYNSMLLSAFDVPRTGLSRRLCQLWRLLGVHRNTQRVVKRYESMVSSYEVHGSSVLCNHGNWQGKLDYAPVWQFGVGAQAVFENLQVLVPEHYDAYLTQKYGDWRVDLPEDQKVGHHQYLVCDCLRPYTAYM